MILLFTDIHLTDSPRDEYRWEFLNYIYNYVCKNPIDDVFILGDLCDRKDKHSSVLVRRVSDTLHRLSKKVPITILAGNHDIPNGGTYFWSFLDHIPNIKYIIKPTLSLNKKYYFLPHSKQPDVDWKDLKEDVEYVFMHQTVNGCVSSSGMVLEGISLDLFGKANIISGDIHVPQKIGKVTYIGSPYQIHYGDSYQGHFAILSTDGLDMIPYKSPRLANVHLTSKEEYAIVLSKYKGDFVRVFLHVPIYGVEELHNHKEKLIELCKEEGINMESLEFVFESDTDLDLIIDEVKWDVNRTLSSDPDHILDEYIKKENITDDFLLKVGRSLIKDRIKT